MYESVKVVSNRKIAENIYKLTLKSEKISKNSKPGQFVLIYKLPHTFLPRPFSVAGVNFPFFEIIFKVVGVGTRYMSELKKNDILDISAPLGNGFKIDISNKTPILVAGGIGIAPLLFLARQLDKKTKLTSKCWLLYGAKTKNELIKLKLNERLWNIVYSTDDSSYGKKGKITDVLIDLLSSREIVSPYRTARIYAAGPKEMLYEVIKISKEYEIDAQLSFEEIIACGIGECRTCVIKTKYGYKTVCKDGPVFRADNFNISEV